MKMDQIMKLIRELACSQGFYGRLLRDLENVQKKDPDKWERITEYLERQNFRDPVDVVMFFEA
mgnify:CR=1 FL=1